MYDLVKSRLAMFGFAVNEGTDAAGDPTPDPAVTYMIGWAEQTIKNNINREEVPDGLKYVWVDMAAAMYMDANKAVAPPPPTDADEAADATGVVSSIREGDTTVSFVTSGDAFGKSAGVRLDEAITAMLNPEEQLAAYRRIKWA